MAPMRERVWAFARLEMLQRLRDRRYVLMMLAVSGLVAGSLALTLRSHRPPAYRLGVSGARATQLGRVARELAPEFGVRVSLRPSAAGESAAARRRAGVAVELLDDHHAVAGAPLDDRLVDLLRASSLRLDTVLALVRARGPGALGAGGPGDIARHVVASRRASPRAERLARAGALSLGMLVYLYGLLVADAVVREKASRVIEVLLAAARPAELLAGKLAGIGVLGTLHSVLLALAGGVLATAEGVPAHVAVAAALLVPACFVLAFAVFGTVFAVAGAAVSRPEDMQYAQLPVGVLMGAGVAGALATVGSAPSTLTRAAAVLPPTSPFALLTELQLGVATPWDVIAGVAALMLSAVALVAIAARLHEGSLLGRAGLSAPARGTRLRGSARPR
jgi:ABC-2 type transport system permease protein